MIIIVVLLLAIAISSITRTTLALKENSQGQADIIRSQCLNGLNKVAWETGVCTIDDMVQFDGILNTFLTEGREAAINACRTRIASQGCKGVCVGAINCVDWSQLP